MSPRRRALALGVAIMLAVAAVAVVGLWVGRSPAQAPAQDRLGPVLLVPGYGGGRESLSALASRIRATGREAEVLTLPGDGTGDLREQAEVLADRAADLVAGGAPSVDVIGYSAGGVVARLWVAGEGATTARRVITLGSPLHGARLAAAGGASGACPPACQQLIPGSALLEELGPLPPGLPWLSIWTEDDQTVQPPDSARLDGAVNLPVQQVCPGVRVEHGQLPTDPLVVGLVLKALGPGPLTSSGPTDCQALRADGS